MTMIDAKHQAGPLANATAPVLAPQDGGLNYRFGNPSGHSANKIDDLAQKAATAQLFAA